MVPTRNRNHAGVLITYQDEMILFDCGEGTQRQFRLAGISPTKLTKICLTHWHGDHVLGLGGLLNTLGANHYNKKLTIYGPQGTKKFMANVLETFARQIDIDLEVKEVKEGVFFESKFFTLEALQLQHSAPCLGFSFHEKEKRNIDMAHLKKLGLHGGPILKDLQAGKDITWKGKKVKAEDATSVRKGKKIAYITDTLYFEQLAGFAKGADVLICEATYDDSLLEKAVAHKHMTAGQAAMIARDAEAQRLVLTHFSQRYKRVDKLLRQAKKTFSHAQCAKDLLKMQLP